MDDNRVTHPTADYGELFEGEEAEFETTFSEADVLGLENGLGIVNSTTMGRYHLNNDIEAHPSNSETIQIQNHFLDINNHDQINSNNIAIDENVNSEITEEVEDSDEDEIVYFQDQEESKNVISVVKDNAFFARLNINKYLKERGFREFLLPNAIPREILAKLMNPSFFNINSIIYGSTYRAEDVYNEIDKFLKFFLWMKIRNSAMSLELKPMLMPILVFFFRDSYINGFKPLAHKLVEDFSRKILQEHSTQEDCLIAIAMSMLKNSRGFEDKYLQEVCQKQHKFVLSEWTFGQLVKFLSKLKGTAIIYILTSHFQIELKDTKEILEDSINNTEEFFQDTSDSEPNNDVNEDLERVLGSVQANLPSIKLYTTNGQPSSAAVSFETSTFAYGMSTSGIRICNVESAKAPPMTDEEDAFDYDSVYSPPIQTINGHEGAVYGLSFHPKTKLLYSVGQDCCLRAWDISNLDDVGCKCIYRGHYGPIWSMDIAQSGNFIATASMDTTARIWIPERSECVRILVGHYFDVDCVKIHPNESYVATGSLDKSARLWSVSDGEMVRVMTGVEGKISALSFHKSGNYLFGGGEDDLIRVWDIREGELVAELPSLNNCKDLSSCGNMLAGCFQGGVVQVWNMRNIVGGEDVPDNEEEEAFSVPAPYPVQCRGSILSLHYKDYSNLYCLGSDPILPPFEEEEEEEEDVNSQENSIVVPNEQEQEENDTTHFVPLSLSRSFTHPRFIYYSINNIPNEEVEINSNSPKIVSDRVPTIRTLPKSISSEDIANCLEDGDAENTNNTITSSDMEFEVDEQMLESFVDDQSLLQS